MSIGTLAQAFVAGAKAHKPEIMIGIGIGCGVGAVVMAAKETPACLEAFEAEEKPVIVEKNEAGEETVIELPLDWKTKGKIFAKYYWLVALLEGLSVFFICFGAKIRLDGYTTLLAMYGLKKVELDDIKRVISEHPENWQKKFNEKMAESHLAQTEIEDIPEERMSNTEVPMPLPLFFDDQARVYFRMSDEELRDAVAEYINVVYTDPFQEASINTWMSYLDHEPIMNGDYVLINREDELKSGALKYNQVGVKEAPNGEPCRVMKWSWGFQTDTRCAYGDI